MSIINSQNAKPFLRWAGGKRWLLRKIDMLVKNIDYNAYHEPFLGGGAVYFHLRPEVAYISDINERLIETYSALKDNPRRVALYLKQFKKNEEEYYFIREVKFRSSYKRAAQFIYLNQMSFNGIYRVNSEGKYNVPYGYRNKYNFDYNNLYATSLTLSKTAINACDFEESIQNVNSGDLVFLDPPYTVTHNLNGFIKYNQKLFSIKDQYRLSKAISTIKEKKAYYILTNAAHKEIINIFDKGDKIIETERQSVVGGKYAMRGSYSELLLTNIPT